MHKTHMQSSTKTHMHKTNSMSFSLLYFFAQIRIFVEDISIRYKTNTFFSVENAFRYSKLGQNDSHSGTVPEWAAIWHSFEYRNVFSTENLFINDPAYMELHWLLPIRMKILFTYYCLFLTLPPIWFERHIYRRIERHIALCIYLLPFCSTDCGKNYWLSCQVRCVFSRRLFIGLSLQFPIQHIHCFILFYLV